MSVIPKLTLPPTVGTPLAAHPEENPIYLEVPTTRKAQVEIEDDALRNFMQGRAQHVPHRLQPRHLSHRPDSAGQEKRLGFHGSTSPKRAEIDRYKQQVLDLKSKCEILLNENETLKKANTQMEALKLENARLKDRVKELEKVFDG